jgi:hypothetical protein
MIAALERYQRDLEEETLAVAARIKALREAAAPGAPQQPSTPNTGAQQPPAPGAGPTPTTL